MRLVFIPFIQKAFTDTKGGRNEWISTRTVCACTHTHTHTHTHTISLLYSKYTPIQTDPNVHSFTSAQWVL